MEMAEPSELKRVKNSFVVRMALIGVGGGEKDHQKHLFPLQKNINTFFLLFFFQKKNTGMSSEVEREQKSGNRGSRFESCRVCLSH